MATDDRQQSYGKYQADAETIEVGYRKALEALSLREDLSPKGKADLRAKYETERKNRVAALQATAALSVKLDREFYTDELRRAKAAEFARVRRTLGDAVLSDIYARRMSGMSAQAILDWRASASDEWETTLVAQLGAAVLSGRGAASDFEAQQNAEAVRQLLAMPANVVDLEDKLAGLRDAESFVQHLDVRAYHAELAPRLGVRAEFVPLPNAPADVKPLTLPEERIGPKGFTTFVEGQPAQGA